MGPVCTIMVGRLDDWLKVAMEREAVTTDPGHLEWAGVAVFKKAYAGERFVRLSKGTTNVNNVKGSNFVDLGVVAEGRTAIVFAAVDNLVKGGAGQGVQCLNVMFGLPEDAGLSAPPAQP